MRLISLLLPLALLAAGCRNYDRYSGIASGKGLVPADRFARYGTEQAEAVAIGRAFGAAYTGPGVAELGRQIDEARAYALQLPDVASVTADTTANLLTVTFRSGWRKAIVPIADGVPADQTPGLPAKR